MNERTNEFWNGRCWKVVNFSLPANFTIFLGRFFRRTVVFNLLNVVSRSFCSGAVFEVGFHLVCYLFCSVLSLAYLFVYIGFALTARRIKGRPKRVSCLRLSRRLSQSGHRSQRLHPSLPGNVRCVT